MNVKAIKNLDDSAVIKWRLTDCCVYECSYCIRRPQALPSSISVDYNRCMLSLSHINRIAKELSENTGKPVKIDLIGGEPTVFNDLKKIIGGLDKTYIKKVNLTSNFYRNNRYWEELLECGIPITATFSYHPEFCNESVESFCRRVKELQNKGLSYVKCESVLTQYAPHIEGFVETCKKFGLDYMVEGDLNNPRLKGISQSLISKPGKPRYEVIDDKGTARKFGTRNSFLKEYGQNGNCVNTTNFLCSRNYDYVYIEQDMVLHCSKPLEHISEFSVSKSYSPCGRSGTDMPVCTLCGNISVRHRDYHE